MRTKWCWRNHRSDILTNHHAKIHMNKKIWRREILIFCCSVFLGRFSFFIQFLSLPQFVICMSFTTIYLCDIFFFPQLNFFYFSCDFILVCNAISFNYMFQVFCFILHGKTQKCSSLVYLLVWLNINSCTLMSFEFMVIAWPLFRVDDLAIAFLLLFFSRSVEFWSVNLKMTIIHAYNTNYELSFLFLWYFLFWKCRYNSPICTITASNKKEVKFARTKQWNKTKSWFMNLVPGSAHGISTEIIIIIHYLKKNEKNHFTSHSLSHTLTASK